MNQIQPVGARQLRALVPRSLLETPLRCMKKMILIVFAVLALNPTLRSETAQYNEIKLSIWRAFDPSIVITIRRLEGLNAEKKPVLQIFAIGEYEKGGHVLAPRPDKEKTFKKISASQFDELSEALDSIDVAAIYEAYNDRGAVADGSGWRISGNRNGSGFEYRFSSPMREPEAKGLVEFAKRLIKLAEIDLGEGGLY